jgi:hypothetical protein
MEPPLEVGGQEGVHGGVVAAVERLVEAEHEELVSLLLGLELGGAALQLSQVSQLLPEFPAAPPVGDEEEDEDGEDGLATCSARDRLGEKSNKKDPDPDGEIGLFPGQRRPAFIGRARELDAPRACAPGRTATNTGSDWARLLSRTRTVSGSDPPERHREKGPPLELVETDMTWVWFSSKTKTKSKGPPIFFYE